MGKRQALPVQVECRVSSARRDSEHVRGVYRESIEVLCAREFHASMNNGCAGAVLPELKFLPRSSR